MLLHFLQICENLLFFRVVYDAYILAYSNYRHYPHNHWPDGHPVTPTQASYAAAWRFLAVAALLSKYTL
jgi:hypothetical protein